MIVTDDAGLAARARHLTTQAKVPGVGYVHDEVGYNYRLTNVAAALGVGSARAAAAIPRRQAQHRRPLCVAAGRFPVTPAPRADWARPSHWLYSVLLPADRDRILAALNAAGVGARPLWMATHRQAPYAGAERIGGAVAEDLHLRGLSLPSSSSLSTVDQDRTVAALAAAVAGPLPAMTRGSGTGAE